MGDVYSAYSDPQLIGRIREGDKAAFRALFDRYYKLLLGTAINILRDEDKGKDAVQEVFLQVWKNRAEMQIRTDLRHYLKRAVINRALNQVRQAKPFAGDGELPDRRQEGEGPEEALAHGELKEALDHALTRLPERCRLVFVLKRLEGLSQKEIAERLGISIKTVENQITKAMKTLGTALAAYRRQKE